MIKLFATAAVLVVMLAPAKAGEILPGKVQMDDGSIKDLWMTNVHHNETGQWDLENIEVCTTEPGVMKRFVVNKGWLMMRECPGSLATVNQKQIIRKPDISGWTELIFGGGR
jgi:hypothetical protein